MLTTHEAEAVLASAGLVEGLASTEVRSRIALAVHLAETGKRLLAFYLVEMQDKQLHNDSGHASAVHYAETVHEIPKRRARELVALGRKLLRLPAIDAAFCAGEIGWVKLLLLARVATEQHEAAWLERGLALSCHDLKVEVMRHKEGEAPRDPRDRKGLPEIRFTHSSKVDALTHELLEKAKAMLSEERGETVSDSHFLRIAAELVLSSEEDGTVPGRKSVPASLYRIVLRPNETGEFLLDTDEGPVPIDDSFLGCDAEIVVVEDEYPKGGCADGTEPSPGELAPKTPAKLRKEILARDGNHCQCCSSRRGLMVHHIKFRSAGGETRGANEITLCLWCHARVHAGLLVLAGPDARHVQFLDRHGRPLQEPGEFVKAKDLSRLAPPVIEAPPAEPACERTTLDRIPAEVDGDWWRRHADLIRCRKGRGLEFCSGQPQPGPDAEGAPEDAPTADLAGAFEGIVGQDELVSRLEKRAKAARLRRRPYPHTLFLGPPGTGKTTLARGVAASIGGRLHAAVGTMVTSAYELVRLLAGLAEGDVLFLDEVHAVPPAVLEVLYEAMAEQRLSLVLHEGARSRTVCLVLPAFTLLAATTEDGKLHDALRSRFGRTETLGLYDDRALEDLVIAGAGTQGFALDRESAQFLVWYLRGTPRGALELLDCVLDEAALRKTTIVSDDLVEDVCEELGYDCEGLSRDDRRYLDVLHRASGPVPLWRLARELGLSERTITERIEPYLFRNDYVRMTPRGREPAPAWRDVRVLRVS